MSVHLKFFSLLKDQFHCGEKDINISQPVSAQEIFLNLFEDKILGEKFLRSTRFAVNCEYVSSETFVKDGDEVAFIPPVSGG